MHGWWGRGKRDSRCGVTRAEEGAGCGASAKGAGAARWIESNGGDVGDSEFEWVEWLG